MFPMTMKALDAVLVGVDRRGLSVDRQLVGIDGGLVDGHSIEVGEARRRVRRVGLRLTSVGVEGRDRGLQRGLVGGQLLQRGLVGGVEGERLLVDGELTLVRGHLAGVLRVGEVHLGDRVVVALLRRVDAVLQLVDLVLRQRCLCQLKGGLGGGEVGVGLVEGVLLGARVDLCKHLAGRDVVTDMSVDLGQHACDFEVDVGLRLWFAVARARDARGHRAAADGVEVQRIARVLAGHEHGAVGQGAEDERDDRKPCHHETRFTQQANQHSYSSPSVNYQSRSTKDHPLVEPKRVTTASPRPAMATAASANTPAYGITARSNTTRAPARAAVRGWTPGRRRRRCRRRPTASEMHAMPNSAATSETSSTSGTTARKSNVKRSRVMTARVRSTITSPAPSAISAPCFDSRRSTALRARDGKTTSAPSASRTSPAPLLRKARRA